jgi:hypothetical protein
MHYLFTLLLLEPAGLELGLLPHPDETAVVRLRVHDHNDRPVIRVPRVPVDSFVSQEMSPPLQIGNRPIESLFDVGISTMTMVSPSVRISHETQVLKLTKFKSHSELVHAGLLLRLATLLLAGEKNFVEVPKTHPWQT